MKSSFLALVIGALLLNGCAKPKLNDAPARETASADATKPTHDSPSPPVQRAGLRAASGADVLAEVIAWNSDRYTPPPATFRAGQATPRKENLPTVERRADGFTIKFPSGAPIPTPTVHRGRLFVSGGFQSKEFYCFHAETGELIWGVDLDDDGPSSGVPSSDGMLFNTESCTLFALDAQTGKLRWAHWLGDPLMSTPTVAEGLVYTVYPSSEFAASGAESEVSPNESDVPANGPIDSADSPTKTPPNLPPVTHVLACFEADTGKIVWQKWIDGDCVSAPVVAAGQLFVATQPGTVYRVNARTGEFRSARRMRATSAPILVAGWLVCTTRADDVAKRETPSERIAIAERDSLTAVAASQGKAAPYLDPFVQVEAGRATDASMMDQGNGFGGSFGGGAFGSPGATGPGGPPGGCDDVASSEETPPQEPAADHAGHPQPGVPDDDPVSQSLFHAAKNLGQGNVSTLQSFQGSRVMNWGSRSFSCMGDELVCVAADSGKVRWRTPLEGDLEKLGGHLAAPPVAAGGSLFVSTVVGEVWQVDPDDGAVTRRFKINSPTRFSPSIEGGRIYVGTEDGKVVCLDTGERSLTGWPMWGRDPAHTGVVPQ